MCRVGIVWGGQSPLKNEFRKHFRKISRIVDCVGCEKCKLHAKARVGCPVVLVLVLVEVVVVVVDVCGKGGARRLTGTRCAV